jgi:hypothetical protein
VSEPSPRACPSARAEPGNTLYGVVQGEKVARLGTPIELDAAFVATVSARGPPEQRFRFAGRCLEGGCAQWQNGGCGVIERVLEARPVEVAGLPRCYLRPSCRWYAQRGAAACAVCDLVITDTRQPIGEG